MEHTGKSERPALETPDLDNADDQILLEPFDVAAETIVGPEVLRENDAIKREEAIADAQQLLESAYRFLFGTQEGDIGQPELSSYQRNEITQLAQEMHGVRELKWELVDNGENFRTRRLDDGVEVKIPSAYFREGTRTLELQKVKVEAAKGETIHDALLRIIGKKYNPEQHRVEAKDQANG
jgi:hypothetical protein